MKTTAAEYDEQWSPTEAFGLTVYGTKHGGLFTEVGDGSYRFWILTSALKDTVPGPSGNAETDAANYASWCLDSGARDEVP
ncbi:MAG: hypothetical protein IPO00_08730 [Betaproteobacteria bacterium]|nr:hypothetical protein [Betaproteobacteria bacterium]